MLNEEVSIDDVVVWAAVRSGDAPAFGTLYDRHAKAVYNYAFRRTGSWSRAEDVTSVVFLEAWRRRDSLTVEAGSALPLLYGIANNVLRHEFRSTIRYRRLIDRLPKSLVEPDHADGVVQQLHDQDRMHAVLAGMRNLTVVEQETVALCVWAGLSYADAAVAMKVPVGTVRSRLARARDRLRAYDLEVRAESDEKEEK